jgi:membrane protease YdiL (CAAX protease family)
MLGWAAYPVWILVIVDLGLALGLSPREPAEASGMSLASTLSAVVLAPVFEELLYRERLLLALRARVGASVAIAVTSVLFALPHVEAWSVLGTFLVGLALGWTRIVAGSVSLCIGIHAGLNLASMAWVRG